MPPCRVLLFRESSGRVPFIEWADTQIPANGSASVALQRVRAAIQMLEARGHELRRPLAAPLRDSIWELRIAVGRIELRVLFFFAGPGVAVISHTCTKERRVPPAEIDRAIRRRAEYLSDPIRHSAH